MEHRLVEGVEIDFRSVLRHLVGEVNLRAREFDVSEYSGSAEELWRFNHGLEVG